HRVRAFTAPKALRSCYDAASAMRARQLQGWLLVVVVLAAGCSWQWRVWPPWKKPTVAKPTQPAQKSRIKLAVLPVDGDAFPQIAASVNKSFHDVKVDGVDDYFLSKVTLEVVQLSIECVQPSNECYSAVGKSLSANKLLLGHIASVG